ncbi:MAG: serine/threonine protein kinase, partial [Planctomycetales bacterium]|nr:serine/threonine protein kinase [Planctomycetales bacterium]
MRCGAYETLSELGRGGFATVHRARNLETGREVALKVLRSGDGGVSAEDLGRFRREIEAARALDHPGIVHVLDASPDGSEPVWVAMELIEGESLSARVTREPLPWREAVEIARGVADAVAHAHSRGILHRDLKPSNILLDRAGRPRVVDFGLAKLATHGSRLTRTGQALGTPAYMSPEQARGEVSSLAPATDVWSLGCVLHEMLTGRPAFEGETDAAVVGNVLLTEPSRVGRLLGDVPRGLDTVVRVSLAKDARRRYAVAGELRDDLDRILRGERLRARLPGAWRWKLGAAALAVAAAVWGGLLARPGATHSPPAAAPATSSDAEGLSARARALRQMDPRQAAVLLRRALALDTSRRDWDLELG